jgi:hypothetical protein
LGNRYEVLRDKLGLWNVLEENDHGWHIGGTYRTKGQVNRRVRVLKSYGMQEVRVKALGLAFVLVDEKSMGLGMAYGTETECRKAHNLMDFSQMGHYAPKERNRSRFVHVLRDDVV